MLFIPVMIDGDSVARVRADRSAWCIQDHLECVIAGLAGHQHWDRRAIGYLHAEWGNHFRRPRATRHQYLIGLQLTEFFTADAAGPAVFGYHAGFTSVLNDFSAQRTKCLHQMLNQMRQTDPAFTQICNRDLTQAGRIHLRIDITDRGVIDQLWVVALRFFIVMTRFGARDIVCGPVNSTIETQPVKLWMAGK